MTSKIKKEQGNKLNLMLCRVREAAAEASQIPTSIKNKVLREAAAEILKNMPELIRQNARDLENAKRKELSSAMIDRLTLTPKRIKAMADGVRVVAGLEDPIGKIDAKWKRPNGLVISKVRVPIGVVLIIYESRPNVTVECASLCFKGGNAVILRGGSEAFYSNFAFVKIFEKVLSRNRLPKACVSFVETTDRSAVDYLLKREGDIHLVIPRGGEALIRKVARTSRIPVIKHYQGVCHVFVDASADLAKASDIVYNAKMQRPGVCNAMETLLVHEKAASKFLPLIGERLRAGGCELRADALSRRFMPWARAAKDSDYGKEFLEKIMAVKVVPNIEAAILHIQKHGSGHTDAILTRSKKNAETFKARVDSASVMVNASTRFSDGFEFGFGAEIGISTDKIHARGPMGLEGLTSYKYLVEGNGQIRQ